VQAGLPQGVEDWVVRNFLGGRDSPEKRIFPNRFEQREGPLLQWREKEKREKEKKKEEKASSQKGSLGGIDMRKRGTGSSPPLRFCA
jgi:hypothetical protein